MKPYIDLYTRILLIIGGLLISLNYLFGIDLPMNNKLSQFLIVLIVFSTIYNVFNRDFYLPFLGHTVLPLAADGIYGDLIDVKITDLPPDTNVVFWASQEGDLFENPIKAYGKYKNSGIGKTDSNGEIVIKITNPSSYKVSKLGKEVVVKPHVHYRYEYLEYPGMFSKIFTKYI